MPSPSVVLTGTLADITNTANPGSVLIQLVNFGANVPRISGTSILVQTQIPVVANGSGAFTATVWRNDQITPASTYYVVKYLNSTGGEVASVPYSPFTAGGTFDLSTLNPLVAVPVSPTQLSFSSLAGNIAVAQMNSGTSASSSTFWRGDGTWVAIAAPSPFTPITHQFLTGMNGSGTFSSAQPAFTDISGSVAAGQLPNPTASTLGGIESFAAVSHQWINAISTLGVPSATQPSAADLSNGTTGTAGTAVVLATSPTLVTPTLGVATATSIAVGDGAVGTPSLTFSGSNTTGIYRVVGTGLGFTVASANQVVIGTNILRTGLSGVIGFSSNADPTLAGTDTGISRNSAGTIAIGAGTAGSIAGFASMAGAAFNRIATNGFSLGFDFAGKLHAGSLGVHSWSATDATAAADTGISRSGAGIISIGNGTQGDTSGNILAASINKVAITAPATSATLTILNGKTLTANNSLILAGTDATTLTFQGTDTYVGRATTDTLTGKTISTSGTGNHIQIAAADLPTAVGASNTFLGTLNGSTVVFNAITRSVVDATAKGWQFIGTATGATTTVGPVTTASTFKQFMVKYQITGYNGGTPVGRFLCGTASISTTALTNSFTIEENIAAVTTGAGVTAIPGLPLAQTLSNTQRSGTILIDGASGAVKVIDVIGNEQTPAVATAPTLFRGASFFSDLGTNLPLQRFQLTVYDTLTAVAASAQTFNSGTYLTVWGRNND